MNNNAAIKALAPWFGGKRTLAARIVRELGEHRCYWEPFCGSIAVLLSKPTAAMETVVDLHGDIVNLARCVQDRRLGPALYRRLRRAILSETLHLESARVIREPHGPWDSPDVERAYHYFLASWFGRNGVAGTSSYNAGFCARYTANGGHAAKRFYSAVESIPAWRRRMRQVTVLRRNSLGVLDRIEDAPGTAIYCDPPYLAKGASYVHDFDGADHKKLAEALGRFEQARVVVSYYADPQLAELYPAAQGWSTISCPTTKAISNQGQRKAGKQVAPEVLIVNGPSYTEEPQLWGGGRP